MPVRSWCGPSLYAWCAPDGSNPADTRDVRGRSGRVGPDRACRLLSRNRPFESEGDDAANGEDAANPLVEQEGDAEIIIWQRPALGQHEGDADKHQQATERHADERQMQTHDDEP